MQSIQLICINLEFNCMKFIYLIIYNLNCYYFYYLKKSCLLPVLFLTTVFSEIFTSTSYIHRQAFWPPHVHCPCYCKYNLCCCFWTSFLQWGWIFQQAYQSYLFCDLLSSYYLGQGKNLIFLLLCLKVHLYFTIKKKIKSVMITFKHFHSIISHVPTCVLPLLTEISVAVTLHSNQ